MPWSEVGIPQRCLDVTVTENFLYRDQINPRHATWGTLCQLVFHIAFIGALR